MTIMYVFFVNSSSTAVNSSSSMSSEWNSSRFREQACLNALISSDVLSYRVATIWCGLSGSSCWDVRSALDVADTLEGPEPFVYIDDGTDAGAEVGACWAS